MVTDMVLKKNINNIHQYQIRALILMDIKKLLEFNPNKYIEDERLILNTYMLLMNTLGFLMLGTGYLVFLYRESLEGG